MNTSAGYYQAPRPPRVPLDEVLIKLHPEGFHQEFEADGINVGPGGLSMRASVLPEIGSTLRCHLDNPTGGEAIEMIGRVVWAHEGGPHVGEFGIRFTHLSEADQTRIEAGENDLSLEPVALTTILNDCVSWVVPLALNREIDIEFDVSMFANLNVVADSIRLKQVFLNLLTNAIKYNRQSGQVGIICGDAAAGLIRIGIKDTGPGF